MFTLPTLIAYIAALSIAVAIPGPGVIGLVGQALGRGFRPAMFFLLGIVLGDLVYLSVAIAGMAVVLQVFAGALLALKVAGGLYLLSLAWRFWTSGGGLAGVGAADPDATPQAARGVLAGLTLTLGNPKTVLFYLALLPNLVDLERIGAGAWLALSLVTIAVLLVVLMPYAFMASRARGFLTRAGAVTRLSRLAAVIVGSAGALILGQAAVGLVRRAGP